MTSGPALHMIVKATEVRTGDFINPAATMRIHTVHRSGDAVKAAYRVRGSSSPGLVRWDHDEDVNVWRRSAR